MEPAAKLLASLEPQKAVASLLALATGYSSPPPERSLLSNLDGFVTMHFTTSQEIKVSASHGVEMFAASFFMPPNGFMLISALLSLCRTVVPLQGLGYVWAALRRVLPEEVTDTQGNIRSMQLTADAKGAVFDVSSAFMEVRHLSTRAQFELPVELVSR